MEKITADKWLCSLFLNANHHLLNFNAIQPVSVHQTAKQVSAVGSILK